MKPQDFFSLKIIRNKFSYENRQAVEEFLAPRLVSEQIDARYAAASIILLSVGENQHDFKNQAAKFLISYIAGRAFELMVDCIADVIKDPLNAACVENIVFNRATCRVDSTLLTGQTYPIAKLPFIITPVWGARAVIRWSRHELCSIATDLFNEEEIFAGELIENPEAFFKQLSKN